MKQLPAITGGTPLLDVVHHVDLLTLCAALPDASVDMILADLPYGATACAWDVVIPLEPMWTVFKRIIKPRGAIVLTASQPFTSLLVCSNLEMFRYEWIWDKRQTTGVGMVKYMPLKAHEIVLVFGVNIPSYFPLLAPERTVQSYGRHVAGPSSTVRPGFDMAQSKRNVGYPKSLLTFPRPNNITGDGGLHPTQKPVALFEYLIRTYTQPGDLVLDPVVGSGTTAIAARNAERHFICGDKNGEYVAVARRRLADTDPFQARMIAPEVVQPSLFGQGRGR